MTARPASPAVALVSMHAGNAPPALIDRVLAVLAADISGADMAPTDALVRAAESLLSGVLKNGEAGRAVALDLLAADACVTWAFEAAADQPAALPARAEHTMQRIAELSL